MTTNRRSFLRNSAALTLGTLPTLVYRGASAAESPASNHDGKILVVIQMSGGNDGVNTVVPFADEGYAKHRNKLRLPNDRLIKIDDSVALHPSMRSAADLLDDGKLAIVQGVGYPNPSRSHDVSMAIWHSAQIGNENTVRAHGWIGRAMDAASDVNPGGADDPQMFLLGNESQPLAIQSRRSTAVTLSNLTDLRLKTPFHVEAAARKRAVDLQVSIESQDVERTFLSVPGDSTDRNVRSTIQSAARDPAGDPLGGSPHSASSLNGFIEQTMQNAMVTAASLEKNIDKANAGDVSYPSTRLGRKMQSISTLIKCGFATPVYYTIQAGYDTHSAQLRTHSRLLREFSDAIKAFLDDLDEANLSDRVCVLGFSEFGTTCCRKRLGGNRPRHGWPRLPLWKPSTIWTDRQDADLARSRQRRFANERRLPQCLPGNHNKLAWRETRRELRFASFAAAF